MNPLNLFRLLSLGLLAITEVLATSVAGLSGQSATFTATASGTAPFSYQWYKDGAAISGATANAYVIGSLSVSDTGGYSVRVSNVAGSAVSSLTSLTVTNPVIAPTISSQPASLSPVVGAAANFSVTAAGTAPFTYQWYKNGTAIVGATASAYSIAAVTVASAGSYKVVVTNGAGSVTSNLATLSVLVPPSISSQPLSLSVASGKAASFSVVASGTAPFSYQWYLNSSAISGATSATYSISAAGNASVGSYSVRVSNSIGSVVSSAATLSLILPPSVSSQPASLVINQGKAASFSVTVGGSAPFTYQWTKNGSAISGATAASYSIAAVDASSAGSYVVIVSNAAGSVSSSAATLSVVSVPVVVTQPISLTVYAGKPASFSVVATGGSGLSYQWYKGSQAIAGATAASYSIAETSSTDASSYSVTVSNSAGSVKSATASLVVNAAATFNRMCTISVRTVVDASNPSSVIGFVTDGSNTRRFLVRGVGPGLSAYGATGVLAQPKIEVRSKVLGVETVIASNSSWSAEPKAAEAFIESGAFALAAGSADAAAVIEVPAGSYTVTLTGVAGSTGVALVEIYELP